MRWCWMTWFRKGERFRLPAQHKKMTFDQASVCVQWKYREWKYQKMSEVGRLAYRFSGVQSSSQEQSSWGNYNREKSLYCIRESMGNQWRGARWGEMWSVLEILRTRRAALFWTCCSLCRRYWGQPKRRELQWSRRERTRAETRVFAASVDRWGVQSQLSVPEWRHGFSLSNGNQM